MDGWLPQERLATSSPAVSRCPPWAYGSRHQRHEEVCGAASVLPHPTDDYILVISHVKDLCEWMGTHILTEENSE